MGTAPPVQYAVLSVVSGGTVCGITFLGRYIYAGLFVTAWGPQYVPGVVAFADPFHCCDPFSRQACSQGGKARHWIPTNTKKCGSAKPSAHLCCKEGLGWSGRYELRGSTHSCCDLLALIMWGCSPRGDGGSRKDIEVGKRDVPVIAVRDQHGHRHAHTPSLCPAGL